MRAMPSPTEMTVPVSWRSISLSKPAIFCSMILLISSALTAIILLLHDPFVQDLKLPPDSPVDPQTTDYNLDPPNQRSILSYGKFHLLLQPLTQGSLNARPGIARKWIGRIKNAFGPPFLFINQCRVFLFDEWQIGDPVLLKEHLDRACDGGAYTKEAHHFGKQIPSFRHFDQREHKGGFQSRFSFNEFKERVQLAQILSVVAVFFPGPEQSLCIPSCNRVAYQCSWPLCPRRLSINSSTIL